MRLSVLEIRESTFHRAFEEGWVPRVGVKFVIWVVLAKHYSELGRTVLVDLDERPISIA